MTLKFNPHPPVAPAHRPIVNLQADRDRLADLLRRCTTIFPSTELDEEIHAALREMGYLEESK